MAAFSDDRCDADGVCPSDPLTFTCEINGAIVLRLVLPIGRPVPGVLRSTTRDTLNRNLPDGFIALDLGTTAAVNDSKADFVLTLSITNASLLAGGEIRCGDGTDDNVAMAGCPILGKSYFQTCAIAYII